MPEQKAPVEGGDSFLENALGSVASSIGSATDAVGSFFEEAKETVSKAPEFLSDTFDDINEARKQVFGDQFLPSYRAQLKPDQYKLDDEENKLKDELSSFGAKEMVWGTLSALKKMGSDKVLGTQITNNLATGIEKKDFEKKVASFSEEIAQARKNVEDIVSSDPKFTRFRDFQNRTKEEYLKERGITSVSDQADYSAYVQSKYDALDPIEKRSVATEQVMFNDAVSKFEKQEEQKRNEMKAFLNSSLRTVDGKTGEQLYEEYQKENEKFSNDNKFLQSTQRVREMEERKFREALAEDPKTKIAMGSGYSDWEEAAVDDRAERKTYELSLRGMKDLKDADKLADEYRKSSEKLNELDIEFARLYGRMKNDPQFKGMSEVEKRNKIQHIAYFSFSPEDRELMGKAESIVTANSQHREWSQMVSGLKDLNPLALVDGIQFITSTWGRAIDLAYSVMDSKDEVPHYVRQEQRNLVYSAEGNMKKLASMLTYNTDALIGIASVARVSNVGVKAAEKAIDITAKLGTKGLLIPGVKIGFTEGSLKFVPAGAKKLAESLITGVATDPIIDNLMVQAPTKASEGFNAITGVLFDATLLGAGKGLGKGYEKSMNQLMWAKMIDEDKNVAKEMAPYLTEKLGKPFSEEEAARFMKTGEDLFYNAYDPKTIRELFEKKGSLHQYMRDTIKKGMDEYGIDQVLDGNGLGVSRNVLVGMNKADFNDISKLMQVPETEPVRYRLAKSAIDTKMAEMESFVKGEGFYDGNRVSRQLSKIPQYETDRNSIITSITKFKAAETKEDKAMALDELNDKMYDFQNAYSIRKTKGYYTLVDAVSKTEIRIDIDDLQNLSDLEGKNMADLILEGKVSVKEKFKDVAPADYLIKGTGEGYDDSFRKKFIADKVVPKIDDFVKARRAEGFPYAGSDASVVQSITAGVQTILKGGIGKFEHVLDFQTKTQSQKDMLDSEIKALGKFVTEQLEEYMGKENVGSPTFINETFKLNEKDLAYPSEIIDRMGSQEKPFNVLFGHFLKEAEGDIRSHTFYVTMGKRIANDPAFADKLSFDTEKPQGAMTKYAANANAIMQMVSKYGIDQATGKFDVSEGVRKAKIVNSVRPGTEMFEDGKLSKKECGRIVKEVIGEHDKVIEEFVYKVFENVDESQAMLIRPMVYNLAAKYQQAKPVVDALFEKFDAGSPKARDMVSVFADLIVSPSTYKDIAERYAKHANPEEDEYLKSIVAREWEKFEDALRVDADKIQLNIDKLKSFVAATKDTIVKKEFKAKLESEIKKHSNVMSYIDSTTKRKAYMDEAMRNMVSKLIRSNVKETATAISKSALVTGANARVLSLKESLQQAIMENSVLEKVAKDADQRKLVSEFAKKLRLAIGDLEAQKKLWDEANAMEESETKELFKSWLSKLDADDSGLNVIDMDALEKQLKDRFDGVYTREYLLKDNPLKDKIQAFANDSKRSRDEAFEKAFTKRFDPEYEGSLQDLYHAKTEGGKKFKELVDSLIAKDPKNIPDSHNLYVAIKEALHEAGTVYRADDTKEDMTMELLENADYDGRLTASFKEIARRKKSPNDVNLDISTRKVKTKDGKSYEANDLSVGAERYNERVWQLDRMEETGMNVRFIRGIEGKDFKNLSTVDNPEGKKIGSLYKEEFERLLKNASGKDKERYIYVSPAEVYEDVMKSVNGIPTTYFADGKVNAMKDVFRKQLGMEDDEFLMGNFGDKDNVFTLYKVPEGINLSKNAKTYGRMVEKIFEIEYAIKMGYVGKDTPTWDKFVESFGTAEVSGFQGLEKRLEEIGFTKDSILSTKKIRKRESAQMSNHSTFDDIKETIEEVLVLEEVFDHQPWQSMIKERMDGDNPLSAKELEDLKNLPESEKPDVQLAEYLETIRGRYDDDDTYANQANAFLKLYVAKELTDGTSYLTKDLVEMRAKVQGLKKYDETFKDHFFGDTEHGRILGKTLFNESEIKENGKKLNMTVAIGAESLKLKGTVKLDYGSERYVTVDGMQRKVLGSIKGADTSFFKNASSDSNKVEFGQTAGDSIKSHLDYEYAKEFTKVQEEMIAEAFNETVGSLTNSKISVRSFSKIDEKLQKLLSEKNVGYGTSSVKRAKLEEFVRRAQKIIEKPQEEGEGMYIKQASREISSQEVVISKESQMAKTLFKEREELLKEIDGKDNLDVAQKEAEKKAVEDMGYWVVSYRYPVPTKYNPGAYKVRFIEDLHAEGKMKGLRIGKRQSAFNPFVVYNKLEADYDGDHANMISARSRIGKVIAKSIIDKGTDVDVIKELNDPSFRNKFIITAQVDKGSEALESVQLSLSESRAKAMEAKQSVGVEASTIRTIDTLIQTFERYVDSGYDEKLGKQKIGTSTLSELFSKYGSAMVGMKKRPYHEFASSVLQLTLDFGNSDMSRFDKGVAIRLLENIGITDPIDFYTEVVSPLSMSYGKFGFDLTNVSEHWVTKYQAVGSDKGKVAHEKRVNEKFEDTHGITGTKRELIESFIEKYGETLHVLRQNPDEDVIWKSIRNSMTKENTELDKVKSSFVKEFLANKLSSKEKKIASAENLKKILESDVRGLEKASEYVRKVAELVKKTKNLGSYDKEVERVKLFKEMQADEGLDDSTRLMVAGYANFVGEKTLANFLSEKQLLEYVVWSDKALNKQFETLRKKGDAGTKFAGLSVRETVNTKESKQAELAELLKEFEEIPEGIGGRTAELLSVRISELNDEISELESMADAFTEEAESVIRNASETAVRMPIDVPSDMQLPHISYDTVDASPEAVNEILSGYVDYASTARNGIKLAMGALFNKYAPEFFVRYQSIFGLTAQNVGIKDATEFHVNEMSSRWFGPSDSIYKQITKSGVEEKSAYDLLRKIERAMLSTQGGRFKPAETDAIVADLNKLLADTKAAGLTSEESFMKRVELYREKVIIPVAKQLNEIQELFDIDLMKTYKGADASIVTDTIEASKGDAQLAIKTFGLKNESEFERMIDNNAVAMGLKVTPFEKKVMRKVVFKRTMNGIEQTLGFLQSIHYQMSYGTMASIFTQNSFIAGIAQILPNYLELRAILGSEAKVLGESYQILKDYKIAGSEDVIAQGTGLGKNIRENAFDQTLELLTKKMVSGIGSLVGVERNKARRAGEIVDSALNNMLGFNDWPLEHMRKLAAVKTVMDKLGFKDKRALDEYMEKAGPKAVQSFNTKVIMEFANSGGGVASSSGIARGTVFEHLDAYFEGTPAYFIANFAVKSLGYLMGWSYHKAANAIEKEGALFTGLKLFFSGDKEGAKAHLADFMRFNYMIAQTVANTTGLYLKFQKYERDNEDRMDWWKFQKSFNNSIVSLEILYGRHKEAFQAGGELGGSFGDKTAYTAYTVVERMFRMFKQPKFMSTMYDHYRTSEILGEESVVASFKYAMDQHYTSFMRFNGMDVADDYNKTIMAQANLGILGAGGDTYEDDTFDQLFATGDYHKWAKKGSLVKFMETFNWFGNQSESAIGYRAATDLSLKIKERIQKDEYLSRLTNGGQIGRTDSDYNLTRIIGEKGAELSEEQKLALSEIWRKMSYDAYANVDAKGNRTKYEGTDVEEAKMQEMLEAQITKALAKKGIDIQELIASNSGVTPAYAKTMAVLDLDSNLKTPLVLWTLISMTAKKIEDAEKKASGIKDISGYDKVSAERLNVIRKDVMLQYQEYLNLNNETVKVVVDQDIRMHHKDLLDKFESIGNFKNVKDQVISMIQTEYLVNNIVKTQKDSTSVDKLQSRYAMAMKGIDMGTETGVNVALTFLKRIEDAPFMDAKSKLAHQAAVLYGLNKTQYGLLKDNAKFSELTANAQKQIVNWAYKISSDTVDFDSNSMSALINKAASERKSTSKFRPNFKSKAMSGQRPNFSKQFDPVRQYLKGKEGMVSDNPREYLRAASDFAPQSFGINNARFPIMQEYFKTFVRGEFFGYESKGIIPSYVVKPSVDKEAKKYINLKKAKKAQPKRDYGKAYEQPKKVSGGAWAGMPLSNLQR